MLQHTGPVRENTNIFTGRIFQVIHLSSGSFKAPVLTFLIELHCFLNCCLSKWEVLSITFENQLLHGQTTQSGRTRGTAAIPRPPVSDHHQPPPSHFPKQAMANHPRCTPSPHMKKEQRGAASRGKKGNNHRDPNKQNQRHHQAQF